jgi:putative flippase GtrA
MRASADRSGRILRFAAVGLLAMAAYAAIVTALTWSGLRPAWLASGLAYALAAVWSYVGHRRFSFRSDAPHQVAGPRFVLVTGVCQAIAMAIPAVVVDAGGLPPVAATALVCLVCPAASFLLNGWFVFADRRNAMDAP